MFANSECIGLLEDAPNILWDAVVPLSRHLNQLYPCEGRYYCSDWYV